MFPKCKPANLKHFQDPTWGLLYSKSYPKCSACLQQLLWWNLKVFTIIDLRYSMLLVLMKSSWAHLISVVWT